MVVGFAWVAGLLSNLWVSPSILLGLPFDLWVSLSVLLGLLGCGCYCLIYGARLAVLWIAVW